MLLSRLLRQNSADAPAAVLARDVDVTGLTADSRRVGQGSLFAALPGAKLDGRAFIPQAVAAGAAAVLAPEGTALPAGCGDAVLITDPEPRLAFARMAAAFHDFRQPAVTVAVTGTNGKTSTAQFARQIWETLGHKAAAVGTLGVTAPGIDHYGAMTTPDPVALHGILADLQGAGITHMAMEASSHGLDQFRLDGVRLAAAGFTNLTRDHLDYHGTLDAYFAAKAMLFERVLPEGAAAVLNADVPEFTTLSEIAAEKNRRVFSYGMAGRDIRVLGVHPLPHGQRLELLVEERPFTIDLPLAGRFQAWNALCALGMVIGAGTPAEQAVPALARLTGVPGRLQHVATHPNGAPVFVDFAHTPDALETVLKALRTHTGNRLVVVFGCGGDRDRGKRPIMGRLAADLADRVIVTDDNPRTEDPAFVRGEVMAGCPGAEEIGDRRAAIREAVRGLAPDDVLVLAGKGHEHGQIVGTTVHPFDDADEARAAVAAVTQEIGA
ncbi:UDP-N-acetylmuramoyl-L-alanyl-D-glutamate--2,6-diaminopimelate ligase [Azospirillum fermentarium]|uniref:UDP-N-acetylmuramoyl-L-alanyl-D-glutamate--2, 6-diaminopimelate ligase n=1 Tax=Azospirillum fermentarium TaxID=1233114 RepID=UPI003872C6E0|nr:UDP-N-acetylmuramoyl-L-alanyl-D-glutamate--2,6-diaminopimelate ligase [Azospirillum fermentarium]